MKIKVGGIKKKAPRTKEVSIGGEDYCGGEDFIDFAVDSTGHKVFSVDVGSMSVEEGRRRIKEVV